MSHEKNDLFIFFLLTVTTLALMAFTDSVNDYARSGQAALAGGAGTGGALPLVLLTAEPGTVPQDGGVSLDWTISRSEAIGCTASASPAVASWNGPVSHETGSHSVPVSGIDAETEFSIECVAADGTHSVSRMTVTAR